MFERFTQDARAAVVAAAEAARDCGSPLVGREHMLVGLAATGEPALAAAGVTAQDLRLALVTRQGQGEEQADEDALRAIGIEVGEIRSEVESSFGPFAWSAAAPGRKRPRGLVGRLLGDHRPFTPGAKKALELSLREAVAQRSGEITASHCLLGLLRDPGETVTALLGEERLGELRASARRAA